MTNISVKWEVGSTSSYSGDYGVQILIWRPVPTLTKVFVGQVQTNVGIEYTVFASEG
jgi:hypothetical protein